MEHTDKSLLSAHLRGEEVAFRELVQRHGDGLLTYLVRISGSRDRAEDLFQETFKRVHEKASMFRGENFKSWLFTIATRLAIDASRRQRRLHVVSLTPPADCDGQMRCALQTPPGDELCDPSYQAVLDEQKQQVRTAVQALPPKQKATVILAYYQQLSYLEVAQILGCSIGAVKTHMSRALAALARKLPDAVGATHRM